MFDGIELRHLIYFVAVAEERHFGRAAERVYVAQPSLSYTIRQLEQRLGTQLFDRSDRRAVRLTGPGETLLAHAREITTGMEDAIVATRAAARRVGQQLRVGYNDGEPLVRRAGALGDALRHLDVAVTFRRLAWGTEGEAVRRGDVDVVLARLPIDDRGVHLEILAEEPRAACLPADHPLARRRRLTLAALRNVPVVRPVGGSAQWQDFWRGLPRPGGHRPPDGPETHGPDDTFDTVATGAAMCFVPVSMVPTVGTDRLAFVPVTDLAPVSTAVGWSSRRRRPPGVAAFAAAARALLAASAHDAPQQRPDAPDGGSSATSGRRAPVRRGSSGGEI